MLIKKDSTDRSVDLYFADSTTALPKTGLAYNSSGIDLWYRRPGAAKTSITEASLSALTDAHADGGFLEIGNGWYRLDLPDAAFATGVPHVLIGGTVTGAVCYGVDVQLVDFDPQSAASMITGINGLSPPTNWNLLGINGSGHVSRVTLADTVTTLTGHTAQTGDSYARIGANGEGLTALASAANLQTVDTVADAILVIANKLDTALELDGAVYRFTVNALEQAPSGGGGGGSMSWSDLLVDIDDIPGSAGKALSEIRTAVMNSIPDQIDDLEAGSSISSADADLIAARVNAHRGALYPNRSQVWVLYRSGVQIKAKGDFTITKGAGETLKVWVDFAGLLGRNEFVESIESIDVDGGTASIVEDSTGVVANLAYCRIADGTPGTPVELSLQVTTTAGQIIDVDGLVMNIVA